MRNLTQTTQALSDKRDGYELNRLLEDVYNRTKSVALSTAGLVISATTTKAKTGAAASYYIAEGKLLTLAAGLDMPAIPATVTVVNANYTVVVFSVDKAGTVSIQSGTEAATLAGVRWPEFDPKRATVGILVIHPTVGAFTGGSSVLSSTAANTVYLSPIGAFDPTANI
tara:strand:+ start:4676 stop:5182 length:507 start_codon:yes stop_codon:yes gene_type:complete